MTEPKTKPARRAKATESEAPRQKRAARRQAAAPAAEGAPALPDLADRTITAAPAPDATPPSPKGPAGKLGIVVALMRRPEGATVGQMGEATGWQPHSVRGALAGALKRKHKLTIVGEPGESGRVYRIAVEQPA
tara:strand:+ start:54760 stop:55161 length:402 start_codon:yes stop_codon:yes gene_type:complete